MPDGENKMRKNLKCENFPMQKFPDLCGMQNKYNDIHVYMYSPCMRSLTALLVSTSFPLKTVQSIVVPLRSAVALNSTVAVFSPFIIMEVCGSSNPVTIKAMSALVSEEEQLTFTTESNVTFIAIGAMAIKLEEAKQKTNGSNNKTFYIYKCNLI